MRQRYFRPALGLCALLCVVLMLHAGSSGVFAQTAGGSNSGPDTPVGSKPARGTNAWGIAVGVRATPRGTKSVTDAISGSYALCARIRPKVYLVDCVGEQLEVISAAMPSQGDYGAAKKILSDTSGKLRNLARANADPAKPRVRTRGRVKGKQITTRPLTPVRADKVKAVNRQAAKILGEAETKLLRAGEASDRRLIAYAQMAKAVGSNKTLLRSA